MPTTRNYDPFDELLRLRDAMTHLLEDPFSSVTRPMFTAFTSVFPLDIADKGETFEIAAAMPGIDPELLQVTASQNTVSIRYTPAEEKPKKGEYLRQERFMGPMFRSVTLPVEIVPDKVSCEYAAGMLTIVLPKAETAKPKRIPIHVSEKNNGKIGEKVAPKQLTGVGTDHR